MIKLRLKKYGRKGQPCYRIVAMDSRVKRDSKSFRHTFIQFMLNKGMSSTAIAKMCGTSTEMIDKYYTSNMALDTMMDTFNKVKGGHLKIVS